MHDDVEDHEEMVKEVRGYVGWFFVRPVGTEDLWHAQWRPEASKFVYREGGVAGTVEVDGEEQRVHVFSQFPCARVHASSKQKKF